jgi:DNA-binding GntR family transcriptional regulator|uniref:GntR family transcriptional regulator n=1 Tax=uncultured Sphingomonas sp. TaxID=158754 RepID=UPI0035C96047
MTATKPKKMSRARLADPADPEAILRLGEKAYRAILRGLFDRTIPAGAFLSQAELMKLLDLPVQPLRDALRALESEGLVKIHPRSGIQFTKADLELARSTYQFRSIIERPAARAFAETGDAAEIQALIDDHHALIALVETTELGAESLAALDSIEQRLHGGIISSLRNPLVETTARRLKNYVALVRMDRLVTKPLVLRTLREHLDILTACAARDGDAAEAALSHHFQAALQRILGMV